MAEKQKLTVFCTPPGYAVFPWITKADTEHDAAGIFHTDLAIPFEEAQELVATLEKARDDFIATLPVAKQKALVARPVYTEELTRPDYPEDATKEEKQAIRDAWEGEPTGNLLFRFKLKNNVTTQAGATFTQEPAVLDHETCEKIEGPVYSGSLIRIKGQVVPYTNSAVGIVGVTLRMRSVFVLEQVGGSGDGSFWNTPEVATA